MSTHTPHNRQSNRRPCRATRLERGFAILAAALLTAGAPVHAEDGEFHGRHGPEIPAPACSGIEVPAGHRVSSHLYARGYQIYRWDGTRWVFVAPDAALFADPCHRGQVGIHFAGPTWEASDGSAVTGIRVAGCAAEPGAIPWLLLRATSADDRGKLGRLTYIQRVHTVGGNAPAEGGTAVGEEAWVPYTAEYYFYREARHDSPHGDAVGQRGS